MSQEKLYEEVLTKQKRIAEIAMNHHGESLKSLAHHIDLKWLYVAYQNTRKDSAVGIDNVSAQDYESNLMHNLEELLNRLKSGRYKAPAVRRVYIPKGNGKEKRPLGLPTFEDKILQRAVLMVLEPVFEKEFFDFSHGFRPGHSAHLALDEFWLKNQKLGGGWLIDLDIRKYFDTIDHEQLRKMICSRVCDGVITRIIGKWLKAGVFDNGNVTLGKSGTPQGGVISPLLSNVYLHEVLDKWYVETVKPRLKGDSFMVRYADDCLMMFKERDDAVKVMNVLYLRFAKYGLELHPEKTKLIDFRKPTSGKSGDNKETFDFLGFTHYWKKSRKGLFIVGKKTAKDRFTRSLKKVNDWCRRHRHWKILTQWKHLRRVVLGHCAYYGVIGNNRRLGEFCFQVPRIWYKWLKRRSRLRDLNWNKFNRLLAAHPLPGPRIIHSVNIAKL
jgi:RNA-directed DNA polymerase